MLAEAVPRAEELATKADLDLLENRLEARLTRFMLAMFIPMWIGVYGTLGAVIVSIVVRR